MQMPPLLMNLVVLLTMLSKSQRIIQVFLLSGIKVNIERQIIPMISTF